MGRAKKGEFTGDKASRASNFASATPRATKPRPVRVQERKVRSLARWSLATLPVLGRGGGWISFRRRDILGVYWRFLGGLAGVVMKRFVVKGWCFVRLLIVLCGYEASRGCIRSLRLVSWRCDWKRREEKEVISGG